MLMKETPKKSLNYSVDAVVSTVMTSLWFGCVLPRDKLTSMIPATISSGFTCALISRSSDLAYLLLYHGTSAPLVLSIVTVLPLGG